MTIKSAAINAKLCHGTANHYYRQYMKSPQLGIPKEKHKQFMQEDIKRFISYIEHDNMSLTFAAGTLKMSRTAAYKYYKLYQNDLKHKIPVPGISGHTLKYKPTDRCSRLIADIYKNNPSIKQIHGNYLASDSSLPDMTIKQELLDEDEKMMLKDKE